MAERFVVRCSGVRESGRRCTVMVDARSEEGRHYCTHPECAKSYRRNYYQTEQGRRLNRERVLKRRQDPAKLAREAAAERARKQRRREAERAVA